MLGDQPVPNPGRQARNGRGVTAIIVAQTRVGLRCVGQKILKALQTNRACRLPRKGVLVLSIHHEALRQRCEQ